MRFLPVRRALAGLAFAGAAGALALAALRPAAGDAAAGGPGAVVAVGIADPAAATVGGPRAGAERAALREGQPSAAVGMRRHVLRDGMTLDLDLDRDAGAGPAARGR